MCLRQIVPRDKSLRLTEGFSGHVSFGLGGILGL